MNLSSGVYYYDVKTHSIVMVKQGDVRKDLSRAALGQKWIMIAPVSIVITAIYERSTHRYGEKGIRYGYVHIEVGHVGQNIYLQAVALGLGTVAVGAFYDEEIRRIVGTSENENPIYIMPIGYPKQVYKLKLSILVEHYKTQRRG